MSIESKSIQERIKKIIVDQLGVEDSKVLEDARFIEDLGADSLDTVELVMAFEEEFGCEIPDNKAELIRSVKDANEYLTQACLLQVNSPSKPGN